MHMTNVDLSLIRKSAGLAVAVCVLYKDRITGRERNPATAAVLCRNREVTATLTLINKRVSGSTLYLKRCPLYVCIYTCSTLYGLVAVTTKSSTAYLS